MLATMFSGIRKYLLLIAASGLLMLLLAPDVCSASKTYTLYYIDTTHNVSRVVVDSTGHPVGSPERLTTGGKYNGFSVSPDEQHVLGMQLVNGQFGGIWKWDQYIESPAKGVVGRIRNKSSTDSWVPSAIWLPKIDSVMYVVPQQVNSPDYLLYSHRQRRVLFHEINQFGPVSADQRYAFVTEDVGCAGEGPADLRVVDLTTGKLISVRQVQFEESIKWLGNTRRFAFIGSDGRVWGGEVSGSGSGMRVRTWNITRYGGCYDIRYLSGKGIYFVQKAGDGKTSAYHTPDLRKLYKIRQMIEANWAADWNACRAVIEEALSGTPGASVDNAVLSADHKLIAAPVYDRDSGMPQIRVFTRDGKSVTVARGKYPRWKGVPEGE